MKQKKKTDSQRIKEVPQSKLETVSALAKAAQQYRTVLVASTRKLPSAQFHQIKKNLRGKTQISVAKKSLIIRAIEATKNPKLQELNKSIGADVALFFSDLDPFALAGLLSDNQSPVRARAGDIALEEIHVEPGPTDLPPGPAISELSAVGLKVAVEGGKLAIKQPATIVKQGEIIKDNVASVLGKLNITPLKVGFEPIAAYDNSVQKVYTGIKIDKKKTLEELRASIGKALGFAVAIKYLTKETLQYFLAKAAAEEKAIELLVAKKAQTNSEAQINNTDTREGN